MVLWRFISGRSWMGRGEGFFNKRSWVYVKKVLWFCVGKLEGKGNWSFFRINIF